MVNKLFGKKLGMTRLFLAEGKSTSVTVLEVGPCVVIQKKTLDKEGYSAIQVGYGKKKESRLNKPLKGHFKAAGEKLFEQLQEIRVGDPEAFELGQELNLDIFHIGDLVHIRALSKGKGFAGVMKRWNFSGGRKTHGSRSHRVPGSIGCSATPGRVVKGRKMPGRMGQQRVTVKNLRVVDIRPEMGVIIVNGPVPGAPNNRVEICKA